MKMDWKDPPAERINCSKWHELFKTLPTELIDKYRYYRWAGRTDWNGYLQPPSSFAVYGSRYLRKLTYDNSLAALRLWGFMLNESERLFRARQMGKRVVAVMGDLGPLPVLVWAFPELVPFYPDCLWWTPFLNESSVLFGDAERLGISDNCCFVRAALGAFAKRAYFPDPDLAIAATGATCDDMTSVMNLAHWQTGMDVHWFEIPLRRCGSFIIDGEKALESQGEEYAQAAFDLLVEEFKALRRKLEILAGHTLDMDSFRASVTRANRLRNLFARLKDLVYSTRNCPMPALEMMNAEFITLTGYGDMDESIDIMSHLVDTVAGRIDTGEAVIAENAVPVAWVNPTADPLLLCWWEDMGGRVTATEYLVRQAVKPLLTEGEPEEILAHAVLSSSLCGSTGDRAKFVIDEAKRYGAAGAIISVIFGSSHCAIETRQIQEELGEALSGPVLTFDLVGPGKAHQQAQVRTRMEALSESLKARVSVTSGKSS